MTTDRQSCSDCFNSTWVIQLGDVEREVLSRRSTSSLPAAADESSGCLLVLRGFFNRLNAQITSDTYMIFSAYFYGVLDVSDDQVCISLTSDVQEGHEIDSSNAIL